MRYSSSLRYQLLRDDGSLLFRSDNAPVTPSTGDPGFSDTTDLQGESWRHFNVRDKHHGVRVIVSEPHSYRNQLERNMIMTAAAPMGLGLPLLFLLLWLSIRRGLSPLSNLSLEIAKRQPSNLTLIDEQSVPLEVQPIVNTLNELLKRMADTLESERRFTDDAAHQLRTPLAAIQTQLYIARNTRADAAHQLALDQLQLSIERGIRLVNQLLTLARLDPGQTLPDFQWVKIGEIAETACAELAPLSLQKDQTLELRIAPGLPLLTGNADMLSMLISNLVDNAIHYAGDGGHIDVTLQASPEGLQLLVCDDGPGIAPDQRDRVFERFYRIAPQHQPGTGLGLAICQRVAELHHATIALSEGLLGRGLTVSVKFSPLPPP
jgi:two-component system sensor histidine kinase QseC